MKSHGFFAISVFVKIQAMEFRWSSSLATASIFFLTIYFLLEFAATRIRKNNTKSPPEAARGWPLIDHLNLLSGPEQPHLTLSNLAEKYGAIFSILLGMHSCLVGSSWEVAKELYNSTNDVVFSNRPRTVAIQLMGYDFAMFGMSKYSGYWREVRKICMLKLLSNHKVSTLGTAREIEIRAMMKSIYISCRKNDFQVPMGMKRCLEKLTLDSMVRIVSGDTLKKLDSKQAENLREQIREFLKMMVALTYSDVVPYLKWLDYFKETKKGLKKTGKVMDSILQSWLEQHKITEDET